MKISINQKIGGLIFIFFASIVLYGLYSRYKISSTGKMTRAIAIETKGFRIGRYEKDWLFVYLVNNKPYMASLTEPSIQEGDNFELNYDPDNIGRYTIRDKISSTDSTLIFGIQFPEEEKQEILVYEAERLIKRITFTESFGFFIPPIRKINIEYRILGALKYRGIVTFDENFGGTHYFRCDHKIMSSSSYLQNKKQ
jgi:hypothetical protein